MPRSRCQRANSIDTDGSYNYRKGNWRKTQSNSCLRSRTTRSLFDFEDLPSEGLYGGNEVADEPPPPIDTHLVTNGGPFQVRLTAGLHDIDWVTNAQQTGKEMTLNVYLDQQLLSKSSWKSDNHGSPTLYKSFLDQTDFDLPHKLPELAKVLVATDSPEEPFAPDAFQYYLQLKLGDKQGDCGRFPTVDERGNKP